MLQGWDIDPKTNPNPRPNPNNRPNRLFNVLQVNLNPLTFESRDKLAKQCSEFRVIPKIDRLEEFNQSIDQSVYYLKCILT